MKKKCRTDKFQESTKDKYQSFTRHRWLPDPVLESTLPGLTCSQEHIDQWVFVCERCGKTRNPLAGLKMFRPCRISLTNSTNSTSIEIGTKVPLETEGEPNEFRTTV